MNLHPDNLKLLNIRQLLYALLLLLLTLIVGCQSSKPYLGIEPSESEQIKFGLEEVSVAIKDAGSQIKFVDTNDADIVWQIHAEHAELKPEGFSIEKEGDQIFIHGVDEAGIMYGSLELAEQIRLYGLEGVKETVQNPYLERRGTKFNIPLDVRTPSYSDASDAAQNNISNMWDFSFWQDYIDKLAKYRFNYISLWSLHPFPSLVKLSDYPDVALDDVLKSTASWKENYHLHGTGLDDPEIINNTEVVRKMTIDEKIAFWKKVMKYARARNIKFYIITWNIFVNGTEGKYGITDEIDNKTTRDYFKKSVAALFRTYPDLEGIGLTTGENMPGAGFTEKEDWAFDTYAEGLLEVAREMPDRKFTFIHRQHQTGAREIAQKFKPLLEQKNIEFLFSFKYAKAHVYSATGQPYHDGFVKDIGGMKTIWGLRNDDTYYFRWGAPDFVREFIQNMPHDVAKGIYFGSDQYVWGRDFLTKEQEADPPQLEIEKHWYQWMLWGRLAYNPTLNNERFTAILQQHFPGIDAQKLFIAWQHASMVYPVTTGFHWGALDFQWYIEGCKSRPGPAQNETGFHDVNRFISLPPHPRAGFQSIQDFVQMKVNEGSSELVSPLSVAKKLHEHADDALKLTENLQGGEDAELRHTINDIQAVALMGKYYAHKIAGSTYVAMYRETKNKQYQKKAISELTNALAFWKQYTETAITQYKNPLWTNRVGHVDWQQTSQWVERDVEIARAE